jgi:hypothetical protein
MTRKSRPRSADEHVDRLLEDFPLNAEQRAFLANWRQGDQLDADHNPDEAQQVALELMRLAYGITDTDAGFDQWALHQLANARLDWRLAFNETVLHRLADTPAQADLPPSEWPNFYFRIGHEGGMEWRGSTSRKKSSASCEMVPPSWTVWRLS